MDAPHAALALLLVWGACGPGGAATLVRRDAPPPIRSACLLAERRCSKCHSLDRLRLARVENPQHWRLYVDRMRRQRGSGISAGEGEVIVRCLVWRSFGAEGLDLLQRKGVSDEQE